MIRNILRTIAIGLLVGILFFVAFRFFLVIALLGLIFKLSGKGRWKHNHWRSRKLAYVDHVRSMDDETYENYKSNFGKNHCRDYYNEPQTPTT